MIDKNGKTLRPGSRVVSRYPLMDRTDGTSCVREEPPRYGTVVAAPRLGYANASGEAIEVRWDSGRVSIGDLGEVEAIESEV